VKQREWIALVVGLVVCLGAAYGAYTLANYSWNQVVDYRGPYAEATLPAGAAEVLFNKPVVENAYMADFTGTTGAEARLVVGDFSNYVIARRQGMNVELVPQLFDVTNNRPTGQRGWFAYARIGGNSVNDAGFKLQVNS